MVTTTDMLTTLQLYQAIFLSLAWAAVVAFHRERPDNSVDHVETNHHASIVSELRTLFSDPQFCLQCFCYSMLAGVSFSIPGFGTSALEDLELSDRKASWVNFAFVFSGVVT